jgi:alpha-galactosidase
VTPTLDRRAALEGARYVINEVQVGGYSATRADFDIPARYGGGTESEDQVNLELQ